MTLPYINKKRRSGVSFFMRCRLHLGMPGQPKKEKSLILLTLFFCALLCLPIACNTIRSMGKNPTEKEAKTFENLPYYSNGRFHNLSGGRAPGRKVNWFTIWKQGRAQPSDVRPSYVVPALFTDLSFTPQRPTVIWLGHSTFLLKTGGLNILADPNLNDFAGPVSWVVKAFEGSDIYQPEHLPEIDVLLISHDHYDHMDYRTLQAIKNKVKHIIVPKGVGSHLVYWGFDRARITELAWHQSHELAGLRVTATPAHHRSNRGFAQNKTLWASFVLATGRHRIFYSGDTGYSDHFLQIGKDHGPFDLALLECGQYNPNWPASHMFPSQTAKAAQDLGAATILPVHWGKFKEAFHPWNEPVNRLLQSADSLGIPVTVPMIGEPYAIGDAVLQTGWWRF